MKTDTTHRQIRKQNVESRDKKLIRLRKRLHELWAMERALPLIELDEPIQRGFQRSYTLRDDIARRRDANDFKRILAVINTTVYCDKIDFKVKKYYNKQTTDIPQGLKYIPELKIDDYGWPAHFKTKWFTYQVRTHVTKYGSYQVKGYWFNYDYFFVHKIEPYFVTHRRDVDPNIAKELTEIKQYMQQNNGWERLNHLQGSSNSYRDYDLQEMLGDLLQREEMAEYDTNYLDSP
jgi:hypothetical protein